MQLVDSHAHLDFVDDLGSALKNAKKAGVNKIVSVGTTLEESKKILELAEKHSEKDLEIWTTAGIHPKDGREDVEKLGLLQCIKTLKQIAESSKKIVAIGECGLDYYITTDSKQLTTDKEKEYQHDLFLGQVELAAELNLPIVIHCRNGWDEIFRRLSIVDRQSSVKGVFHCWTGDWNAAKKALDLGFYISFSGIVTFKNAPEIQEVAKRVPIDRMLIETDSPFLAPEPMRGKKNSPENVKIVAQFIANLRNLPLSKIASATSENAAGLFGLK
jgi:TatD DNase family protein